MVTAALALLLICRLLTLLRQTEVQTDGEAADDSCGEPRVESRET